MNLNNTSPTDSLDRRNFFTRTLAVSAVTAVGAWSASEAPLHAAPLPKPGPEPRTTLVISAESGEIFTTELVPGSMVDTQDPKLGRVLLMEVILDGFGKSDISVDRQARQIEKLAHVDPDKHRPPTCLLTWGTGRGTKLKASVLTSVTGFSLYARDGTPLRAHMLLDFVVLS
jgi:hypothetical protein